MVLGMAQIMLDRDYRPDVLTHEEFPWLMASLDGWDAEHLALIEIKIGNYADHAKCNPADPFSIPRKYYPQLQHQILVTNAREAHYVSYHIPKGVDETRGSLKIVPIPRDESFLSRYFPIAEAFYNSLLTGLPFEAPAIQVYS